VNSVEDITFVVESPNIILLPTTPGGPSQILTLTEVIVEVVVDPVW